ncbi:MAG: hypothetical protein NT045_08455 [Candidatus Aureabacteria bacterium]|nr:hypothetical protein [Candidatus Auribacterota bacterium]
MKGLKIERIKMHQDARGKVFEPLTPRMLSIGKLKNVHVATLKPAVVRGNHRHTKATEHIIFSGQFRLLVQDRTGHQEQYEFHDGECVRLTFAPGIAHALLNIGDADTFIACFVDMSSARDVKERVPLISEIGHI